MQHLTYKKSVILIIQTLYKYIIIFHKRDPKTKQSKEWET